MLDFVPFCSIQTPVNKSGNFIYIHFVRTIQEFLEAPLSMSLCEMYPLSLWRNVSCTVANYIWMIFFLWHYYMV